MKIARAGSQDCPPLVERANQATTPPPAPAAPLAVPPPAKQRFTYFDLHITCTDGLGDAYVFVDHPAGSPPPTGHFSVKVGVAGGPSTVTMKPGSIPNRLVGHIVLGCPQADVAVFAIFDGDDVYEAQMILVKATVA